MVHKHIETLKGFKKGTVRVFSDTKYEFLDAIDSLWDAIKGFSKVLFTIVVWFFALFLMLLLPLATWLRLKWEKDLEVTKEKAKQNYIDRMTCLHQKGE